MRIVILGAGMIGVHIARELIAEKREVVLIEKDAETAAVASSELDCLVLNEDGSRPEVLRKAGIEKADWFLALTGADEANIVACGLVAAENKRVRTVARVDNPFYASLSGAQSKAFGLDTIVSPTLETAKAVVRIVEQGFAEDIVPLHEGRLQLRYQAPALLPRASGKALKSLRGDGEGDFLVAAVARDGGLLIPDGEYVVSDEDGLYLLGTPQALDGLAGQVEGVRAAAKRILIIGASRVGARLVERLTERERERAKSLGALIKRAIGEARKARRQLFVLETDRDAAKRLAKSNQGVEVTQADSSEEGVLEKAGVAKADLVICATESQTFNILTAKLAKSLGAKKSVAIALNDRFKALAPSLEVDAVVSVKSAIAAAVLELVRRAHIRTIHDFFEDDVEIVELELDRESAACGRALKDLSLPKGVLVVFALQGGRMVVPSGSTMLQGGDTVGFVARKAAIAGLERVFGGAGGA